MLLSRKILEGSLKIFFKEVVEEQIKLTNYNYKHKQYSLILYSDRSLSLMTRLEVIDSSLTLSPKIRE